MLGFSSISRIVNLTRKCISSQVSFRFYGAVKKINITVLNRDGAEISIKADVGNTIYDVITDNLQLEDYGMCGGACSCSTCHVIFRPKDYNLIQDPLSSDEKQLLEHAYDTTPTSRLGCQITIEESMDGLQITLPKRVFDCRDVDL